MRNGNSVKENTCCLHGLRSVMGLYLTGKEVTCRPLKEDNMAFEISGVNDEESKSIGKDEHV